MFVELHMLQNFAPSCLNRDDTNSPKDCEFGGYRRARISSQCIKRSIRNHFRDHALLPEQNLAQRTKRLVDELADRIADKSGKDLGAARQRVTAALASVSLTTDEEGRTQYLLFLGNQEINRLAGLVVENWDALGKTVAAAPAEQSEGAPPKKKTARQQKAEARNAVDTNVAKAVEAIFDGGKAADLALFGRMLADHADLNIDAACQVAHALSTNKVSMEMDFYTAVDDLKTREEDAGADMIGTVEFNSSCFYRYANIDLSQLKSNLHGDEDLARKTVSAFVRASVEAIPTGKQNSMAAQNPPSLVFAVVRDRGLWSLANAFVRPARPGPERSLVQDSIAALDRHWGRLLKAYGGDGIRSGAVCLVEDAELDALKPYGVDKVAAVIDQTLAAVTFDDRAARKEAP